MNYGIRIRLVEHSNRWCIDVMDKEGDYHYTGYYGLSLEEAIGQLQLHYQEL